MNDMKVIDTRTLRAKTTDALDKKVKALMEEQGWEPEGPVFEKSGYFYRTVNKLSRRRQF